MLIYKLMDELEIGDAADALHQIVLVQNAFTWMLCGALKDCDPLPDTIRDGLYAMMNHQTGVLEKIVDQIECKDELIKEYGEQIEALTKGNGDRTPIADRMREEFIQTKAREGASASDIAAAMNTRREDIDAVIAQLQGAGNQSKRTAARA